jgi:fumarate hydratase class II
VTVMGTRKEIYSLGEVDEPSTKLWGAQTQRSLEHFIGQDLIPCEMIAAYATLKKPAANADHASGQLDDYFSSSRISLCAAAPSPSCMITTLLVCSGLSRLHFSTRRTTGTG